jgi:hypothetical protein
VGAPAGQGLGLGLPGSALSAGGAKKAILYVDDDAAGADYYVRAGQAACAYS